MSYTVGSHPVPGAVRMRARRAWEGERSPRRIARSLLATGRSALRYGPNFRARCSMLLCGQAAGVAAALCCRQDVAPRCLDVSELQRILVNDLNCPLANEERLRELGLG